MKINNSLHIDQYEDFLKHYCCFKKSKNISSLNICISILQSCFQSWDEDFYLPNFNNNINLLTLFSLLAKDDKPKATLKFKLKSYQNYLNNNQLSFVDHLNEAFLMHMQKETTLYDNYPKKYKFLFFIAQEIKYALFKIIRKILQLLKRDFLHNPSPLYVTPSTIFQNDLNLELHLLFNSNKLLYSIVFSLIYENSTWKNIKKKFNLNNQNYILLKKEVNSWINTVLSSN